MGLHDLLEHGGRDLVQLVGRGDAGELAALVLEVAAGVGGGRPLRAQLLYGVVSHGGGQVGAVGRQRPGVRRVVLVPVAGHVRVAQGDHLLVLQGRGVGLGTTGQVDEGVDLLADLDGIGLRRRLAVALQLVRQRALSVERLDHDLAAVELVVGVEVLGQRVDRAHVVVVGVTQLGAGQLGQRLLERLVGRQPDGHGDAVLADPLGGRASVVAGELDARR